MKKPARYAVVGIGTFVCLSMFVLSGKPVKAAPIGVGIAATNAQTSTASAGTSVSAVGKIELVSQRPVILKVGGQVTEVKVKVGDVVKANDSLLVIDTEPLNRSVKQAEMTLEMAQIGLSKAKETVRPADIAIAEANLLSAQEQLALAQVGPTKEARDAATAANAAALAAYNELKAGPNQSQITQATAALKLAELDLQGAQREYDKVAWMPDVGMTPESANLQRATFAYQAAQANYTQATKQPTDAQLQQSLSGALSAQDALNQLSKKPTPSDISLAKASVAVAKANLDKLKEGVKAGDVRLAELGVEQAQMALDQAKRDLANAQVAAPIAGTVLAVNVEVGEMGGAGTPVIVLSDLTQLRLVVNVEQKDIQHVKVGQEADLSVYGLTGSSYVGVVEKIAPQGQTGTAAVVFPVTLQFKDGLPDGLLPGMTATALFGQKK